MLTTLNPRQSAFLIAAVLLAVIVGAWIFEWAGYAPCDLCLKQRWGYYAGVPLALVLAVFNPSWMKWGLGLLLLILVGNAVFGVYHSGVEWKWWEGPTTCGAGNLSGGLPDLTKPAVLCNEAAIRILGLSLAGWNAVISAGLAAIAFAGLRRYGSSSVSQ
jgi:disulfide bond formation protein DsbB